MTPREIYPNAPLRFVALEIRYGFVPDFAGPDGRAKVYQELRDEFPIAETAQALEVSLGAPPQTKEQLRMFNRERTRSVTVGPELLAVNTSAFIDFQEFVDTLRQALAAIRHAWIAAVSRVGIRYIDEIRVPGVEKPSDWSGWIDERLLGGIGFGEAWKLDLAEGVLGIEVEDAQRLMLRYGPRDQPAVDPDGPLKLLRLDGHFFLLDLDSFWQVQPHEVHDFDADEILETCAKLDQAAHDAFERALTDRLRDEVLRKEPDGGTS